MSNPNVPKLSNHFTAALGQDSAIIEFTFVNKHSGNEAKPYLIESVALTHEQLRMLSSFLLSLVEKLDSPPDKSRFS